MKKAVYVLISVCLVIMLTLSACKTNNSPTDTAVPDRENTLQPDDGLSDRLTVTDMLGRTVSVPKSVRRPVCIGAGSLRLYSYIGDMSILAGVEQCEKGFLISSRPYQYANDGLFKSLPSVGAGGPQGSADAEAILSVSPDVIFAIYISLEAADFDELQKKTGVPVVVLSYGKTEAFDINIIKSLELMGKILGREERAESVCSYINSLQSDLNRRTEDIADNDKKSVYLGYLNKFGSHGIGSSTANYSLFNAVNASNVLDKAGYKGYQGSIDKETLITLAPDVIILDAGGIGIFKDEYKKNTAAFDSLDAFENGNVYVQMPYNAYYTNLETAYANAYFIGKTLFPDRFSDIDITEKLNEISKELLGAECSDYIYETAGVKYGKLDLNLLK